jgi:hypothetical protein
MKVMQPDSKDVPAPDKALCRDRLLSIKYQLEWIRKLKEQVDWANNPEFLTDFVLYLGIRRRYEW